MRREKIARSETLAWVGRLTCLIAASGLVGATVGSAQVTDQQILDQLRLTLESAAVPLDLEIGGERILAAQALPAFYEQRVYESAWVRALGPSSLAIDLVETLDTLEREGLDPAEYHAARMRQLLTGFADGTLPASPEAFAELDLLLTDAFLMLGSHLISGRVDPSSLDREWLAVRREVDLVEVLSTALEEGAVREALESLLPEQPGYYRLRDMGERYRGVVEAGGWQPLTAEPPLRVGDRGPGVRELQRRLSITDGLVVDEADPDTAIFDENVEAAVRRFQSRHGLDADGVVGRKTLAALNVSAEERLRQIYLNLERWRWLPQSLGERYLVVNLPAFDLRAVEAGETVLEMRVAVGRRYRRTPVFSDTIRYLVFNPHWEIPGGIAVRDKLPEIRKDLSYLDKQGIRVFTGWGAAQREVDPETVDWSSVGAGNFPFRLRQDPGPLNALGRVKFMFPNRFNVYLHDTPAREVFQRTERDVSSGCIRLEKPLELAEHLLRANSDWRPGAIQEYLRDYGERTMRLEIPWPVHLLYWTAWVDESQIAHFRTDLYERDLELFEALYLNQPFRQK